MADRTADPSTSSRCATRACAGSGSTQIPLVPAAPARPRGAVRGDDRRAGRAQGPGQDPPRRAVERRRGPAADRAGDGAGRVGAEPLQRHATATRSRCSTCASRSRSRSCRTHRCRTSRTTPWCGDRGAPRRHRHAGACSRGCSPARRSCCRFPAPDRSRTSRRTSTAATIELDPSEVAAITASAA